MITAQPGVTFEAIATAAAGLTGTLGVRVRTSAGADFLARTTAGIAADVTVGVTTVYRRQFTAPTNQGQYSLVWDDGTAVISTEELVVTYTPAGTETAPLYLTRAEVKATAGLTGTFPDADIDRALNAACRGLDEACGGRHFYPDTDATTVRYYRPQAADRIVIDDLIELTTLESSQFGDGLFTHEWTLNSDIILEPLNAPADGWPYTRITLNPWRGLVGFPYWAPRSVKLTGQFGWASTPAAIVEATGLLTNRLLQRSKSGLGILVTAELAARIAYADPDVKGLISPFVREKLV